MRILLVNDYRAGGGAELVVEDTSALLRERGHDVEHLVGEELPGRRTPWSYVASPRMTRALRAAIARFRPDVVHFHNVYHHLSPSVLAARGAGRTPRWVLTAHDFHLICPNSGLCWFDRRGGRHLAEPDRLRSLGFVLGRRWDHRSAVHGAMKLAQHLWAHRLRRHRDRLDAVICPGQAAAGALRRGGVAVPVHVVPNPFDAAAVRRAAEAARGAAPRWPSQTEGGPDGERRQTAAGGGVRLAFVGRVEREKGLATVLEAWPTTDATAATAATAAELLVVGGGSDLERCRRIARDRGLADRVRFAGPRPRHEALAAMAAADALLLPSRTPEVAPMVLFEGLALGTPVIASSFGAMHEILQVTGEAHAIDPMDPASLPAGLAAAIAACRRRPGPDAAGAAAGSAAEGAAGGAAGAPAGATALSPRTQAFLDARRPERYAESLEAIYRGAEPGEAAPDASPATTGPTIPESSER